MGKRKMEKSKTEERLEKLREKVAILEGKITRKQEKANIRSQINELKNKLKEMK